MADGPQVPLTTSLRCEVFPLVWWEGQAVHLRRDAADGGPAWRLAPSPGADPSLVVREALAADLPGLSRPGSALVHSTSWRFEPGSLMLVLSYLAILEAPPGWRGPPPGFSLEPLSRAVPPVRRGCAEPIGRAAVLAHGLRHFALLRVSDPAIAAALSAEWHRFLAGWQPLPAGLLDHYDEEPRHALA